VEPQVNARVVPLRSIQPHPHNPRFDLGDLADLTADIRDNGLIEPLVVVPGTFGKRSGTCGDCGTTVPRHTSGVIGEHIADGALCPGSAEAAADDWFVIAGHRRREAALRAGLELVPCVTRFDLRSEAEQVALMMRENYHRRDLTPLEEATGYDLLRELGWTATRIAQQVKRSKKTIDRRLALKGLSDRAQRKLRQGLITLQDAEALVGLDPEKADRALRSIGTPEFRQDVAREQAGTDDRNVIAHRLRSDFLDPFLNGSQRPPRQALPTVRREVVTTLANRLPRRTVSRWLDALGVSEPMAVHELDPDRALLALAVTIETDHAGLYDLLHPLGYEPSPVEIELLEGA